jgi:hypothetical protein
MALTAERLRQLVHYDSNTGHFTHAAPRKKIRVGERAGTLDRDSGYVLLTIDRRHYYGHRLAFLYMTGAWPVFMVDHKDGNRANNVYENLRDAPRVINQQNLRGASKASSSGLLGAFKKRAKWESRIKIFGETLRLGIFDTPEAAHAAYLVAKRKYHPGCTI